MAERITEDLWRLEIPLVGNPLKNLNSYLLTGERSLLIDTGFRQAPCQEAMERELAETYGKRDADGQLAVRGGTVEFDTQKALDEFRKARQELNETPAQTEFKPVQAPAPATITPAQLEALEGFIEFEEGRTWDCRG